LQAADPLETQGFLVMHRAPTAVYSKQEAQARMPLYARRQSLASTSISTNYIFYCWVSAASAASAASASAEAVKTCREEPRGNASCTTVASRRKRRRVQQGRLLRECFKQDAHLRKPLAISLLIRLLRVAISEVVELVETCRVQQTRWRPRTPTAHARMRMNCMR